MAAEKLRDSLVDALRARGAIRDAEVERAFRAVPREQFVPGIDMEAVYRDDAIATKQEGGVAISSSSQPAIMALMLEQLGVQSGQRVLEIGAGTGYNAALLRELVGDGGSVTTVDIDPEVVGWARERLDAAGYIDVKVVCADGADGWQASAPYDRIELTVGAADIAQTWVEQLREGGLLVLPLQVVSGHVSIAFEKRGGVLLSRSVLPCGFMPLRGRMAYQPAVIVLDAGSVPAHSASPEVAHIHALLSQPASEQPWPGRFDDGSLFYIGLWGEPIFALRADTDNVPFRQYGIGLVEPTEASLAIVASPNGNISTLRLFAFGGWGAACRLRDAWDHWVRLGSPGVAELQIEAVPLTSTTDGPRGDVSVDTGGWRLWLRRTSGPMR